MHARRILAFPHHHRKTALFHGRTNPERPERPGTSLTLFRFQPRNRGLHFQQIGVKMRPAGEAEAGSARKELLHHLEG